MLLLFAIAAVSKEFYLYKCNEALFVHANAYLNCLSQFQWICWNRWEWSRTTALVLCQIYNFSYFPWPFKHWEKKSAQKTYFSLKILFLINFSSGNIYTSFQFIKSCFVSAASAIKLNAIANCNTQRYILKKARWDFS